MAPPSIVIKVDDEVGGDDSDKVADNVSGILNVSFLLLMFSWAWVTSSVLDVAGGGGAGGEANGGREGLPSPMYDLAERVNFLGFGGNGGGVLFERKGFVSSISKGAIQIAQCTAQLLFNIYIRFMYVFKTYLIVLYRVFS